MERPGDVQLQDQTVELLDPTTGEVVSVDDADALCEALARVQEQQLELLRAERAMRHALGALASADARTAHVIGRRWRATVERPATSWDGGTLRRLWDEVPEARAYLRIERLGVQLRQIDQLRRSSGPGVEAFREQLLGAERPSEAAPLIRLRRIG